jgi:hypothetical protein
MNMIFQSLYYQYILDKFHFFLNHQRHSEFKITKDIQSNNNNNIVLSMLYAEICPKVRRHIARGRRAICLLTLGHISAYNMDNTKLLYNYYAFCKFVL